MSRLHPNKSSRSAHSSRNGKVEEKPGSNSEAGPVVLTPPVLRRWPLPQPDEIGDKEERGRVLVIGGAPEMPGAVMLAATAALRAGAGKLRIATCASIAPLIASAIPESRVFSLPETKAGSIALAAADEIIERAGQVSAVLIGPGMVEPETVSELMKKILPDLHPETLILDAAAFDFLADAPEALHQLDGKAIITPHAGEMAHLLKIDKETVCANPIEKAREAAERFKAVVALKGSETFIVSPEGELYCNRTGNVGLATSGSGDALAGVILGLAGRGAEPIKSASWGVYLHGSAGDRLARRMGKLGFLARELLPEIPILMSQFDPK